MIFIFRHSPFLLLLASVTTLSGCHSWMAGRTDLTNMESLAPKTEQTINENASAYPIMLRGEIVIGHELSMISLCKSHAEYWLALPQELSKKASTLISLPYTGIYGEVMGRFSAPPKNGFASDFSAVFNVSTLKLISKEINGCTRPPPSHLAFGNEPFWALSLSDNALVFNQFGKDLKRYPLLTVKKTKHDLTYKAKGASLTIRNEICSDSMSDTLYGWTATLEKEGASLQGCAKIPNENEVKQWSGIYQNKPSQGPLSVKITLLADHNAIIETQFQNNLPIQETGIWQPFENEEIEIITSRHQKQFLISTRTLKKNASTFSIKKEILGDKRTLSLKSIELIPQKEEKN